MIGLRRPVTRDRDQRAIDRPWRIRNQAGFDNGLEPKLTMFLKAARTKVNTAAGISGVTIMRSDESVRGASPREGNREASGVRGIALNDLIVIESGERDGRARALYRAPGGEIQRG